MRYFCLSRESAAIDVRKSLSDLGKLHPLMIFSFPSASSNWSSKSCKFVEVMLSMWEGVEPVVQDTRLRREHIAKVSGKNSNDSKWI